MNIILFALGRQYYLVNKGLLHDFRDLAFQMCHRAAVQPWAICLKSLDLFLPTGRVRTMVFNVLCKTLYVTWIMSVLFGAPCLCKETNRDTEKPCLAAHVEAQPGSTCPLTSRRGCLCHSASHLFVKEIRLSFAASCNSIDFVSFA